MATEQKIVFDFNWAFLKIQADFDRKVGNDEEDVNIKTFNSSPISDNHIFSQDNRVIINFYNILKSEYLDDSTPIQYISSNDLINLFFLEETNYKLIFEINSSEITLDNVSLFNELRSHNPEIFNKIVVNEKIAIFDLNFKSHVGEQLIDIIFDNFQYDLPIEVRSRKINYESDYPAMISDLAKYTSSILFDKDSSLFHGYEQFDRKETKYEDYMLLEYIFKSENLPSVQEYLSKNLYSKLDTFSEEVPLDFAYNVNSDVLCSMATNPLNIIESNQERYLFKYEDKYLAPIFIDEIKYEDNLDIPENRFYKYFLEYIKYLISTLKNDKDITGPIKKRLITFESMINTFLARDYFSEISKLDYIPFNSQVLQKKEGYRDIFEYFLVLEVGYKINCDLITNEIKGFEKRLSQIYEYWCYFKLYELINELSVLKMNFNNFIDEKWALNIQNGFVNDFMYMANNGKEVKISLAYKQDFINDDGTFYRSYSLDMEPDFTISIEYDDLIYFIHFDAKYKVEKGKPKSDDIQKMHTYKDSIENSLASYVIFPGNSDYKMLYTEPNNDMMSVGAFSLNPCNSEKELLNIKEYLIQVINTLVS